QRRERYWQDAWRKECRGERLIHLRTAGIAHEFVVDWQIPDAVEKCSDLIAAEIVPIDSGALNVGCRSGCGGWQRQSRRARRKGGFGQKKAAGKFGHNLPALTP